MLVTKRSKRFKSDVKLAVSDRLYSLDEALELLYKFTRPKFDPTVELHFSLNIDASKGDQNVRGSIALPYGIGKERKVLVFADGAEAEDAKKNGADFVGLDELVDKIQKGWLEFDIALAIPRVMKNISKLGKVLGPRGLMPSPKNGTLTESIGQSVSEFKKGRIEFKNDKSGNLHVSVGKTSFDLQKLRENIIAFVDEVKTLRPQGTKGFFVKRMFVCHTQSPSIQLSMAPF